MKPDFPEVVILNDCASLTGGSSAVAINSARGLAACGVGVTFFSCIGPIAPALRDVPNLAVICLDQEEIAKDRHRLRAFARGWRNGTAVAALRALLARKSPESTVVHAHTWTKALSPFALSTVTDLGFPLVVTLHDFFIACPNGGFFDYRAHTLCERQPLSASCWACSCDRRNFGHKLWRGIRTVIQNRVLEVPRKVTRYIAVSEFSLERLRPSLPPAAPVTLVRNPVDCPYTDPVEVEHNSEFVFVGRFEVEKGALLFAQAVQAAGVPACFIGDGSLLPELRRLCPQARFTGWLDSAGIRAELQHARALVFPPLWYETLGLVVIEAAALGVPALISDGCAATDNIRSGINGLHFAHGSAASLSWQMSALAKNPEQAKRLGRAAHAWYWDRPWTTDSHVAELLEIYRDLVGIETATVEEGALQS